RSSFGAVRHPEFLSVDPILTCENTHPPTATISEGFAPITSGGLFTSAINRGTAPAASGPVAISPVAIIHLTSVHSSLIAFMVKLG
ncbi:MAG: hypothetical protein ACRCXD_04435, partial [Luteolibacter sp.]